MTESLFPEITTIQERRAASRNPEPEFTYLSMGAGVQGTAITLLIAEGRIPKPSCAIFADTGWEPKKVYDHLDRLEDRVFNPIGLPLYRVTEGNIAEDAMNERNKTLLPLYVRGEDGTPQGLTARTCTGKYKVSPVQRKVRELLGAGVKQLPCRHCGGTGERAAPWLVRAGDESVGPCSVCKATGTVIRVGAPRKGLWARNLIGFSTDEIDRVNDNTRVPYVVNAYPLLDIGFSRQDCIRYLDEQGWGDTVKSSCIGCPFHDNAEWRRVRENPDEWQSAVAVDAALRDGRNMIGLNGNAFLHPDRVPLPLANIHRGAPGEEMRGCSPYGCRSEDPIEMPALWDDVDGALF